MSSDVDVERLWAWFERFVAADTVVPAGENQIDPLDPRLTVFARDVAAPALEEIGATVEIDRVNNVVARFGKRTGAELLLLGYPALHHGNEMEDPLRARRGASAGGDELWFGRGASQSKGGLTAVLGAVSLLRRRGIDPAGRLLVGVCSEGSSTHASSAVLYESLDPLPAGSVLTVGTRNRISLGNRGRVDIEVEIHGEPTHSSVADELGRNPIPVVAEVQRRLDAIELEPAPHPQLGRRSLLPYKLSCGPVAPHTTPTWCRLVLDRRLLPDDDPDAAVADVAAALTGLDVTVSRGRTMLPALVDDGASVVQALQRGAERELGHRLEMFYPPSTFDAGYACSLGVPTVMCGPLSGDLDTTGVLGDDFVSLDQLVDATRIYAGAATAPGTTTTG
jgi:acetylornithine deacetylase/succinyl-diaminopimelate desuccinylase-like protein